MKPLKNKINLLNLDIQGIVKMEIIGMSLLLFLAGWFAWETWGPGDTFKNWFSWPEDGTGWIPDFSSWFNWDFHKPDFSTWFTGFAWSDWIPDMDFDFSLPDFSKMQFPEFSHHTLQPLVHRFQR